MEHLFGKGIEILWIYLLLCGADLVTGYAKALKNHNWCSAFNLQGLVIKFATLCSIISAAAIDHLAPAFGVHIPINLALVYTGLICLYEISSILENSAELGAATQFLSRWLGVVKDQVEKKGDDK